MNRCLLLFFLSAKLCKLRCVDSKLTLGQHGGRGHKNTKRVPFFKKEFGYVWIAVIDV